MNQNPLKFTAIDFDQGPCYGDCPVYTLTIYSNGQAILLQRDPHWLALELNPQEWEISKKTLKEIDDILIKYSFRSLKKGTAEIFMTDMAVTELTVRFNDGLTKKTIRSDGANEWPRRLKTIENHLIRLSGVESFLKKP